MTELATPEDVRRTLARQIVAGELRPGQRLGAERALAAELGVSRALLRQALSILEDGGMIRRVPGRGGGTYVSRGKIERDMSSRIDWRPEGRLLDAAAKVDDVCEYPLLVRAAGIVTPLTRGCLA